MDDSCSSKYSEGEDVELLLMGIENIIPAEEVEGVVDLEAELVSALEELRKYKRMSKNSKLHMT